MINRLKRLPEARFRISVQLYAGIGGAVALTIAASLVGWFSFSRVGAAQSQVNAGSIPELAAAFGVAQHSSTLVAAAPRLTAAGSPAQLSFVSARIGEAYAGLEKELAILGIGLAAPAREIIARRGLEQGERFQRIRANVNALILNIEAIEDEMEALFELTARREALRTELEALRVRLDEVVIPAVDDQLFYTVTGYRDLGAPPAPREEHFSEREFAHYRHMAELQANANIAIHLLESAFAISEAPFVEPLRERFEASVGRIEQNLLALEDSPLRAEVAPLITQLSGLGIGDGDGFDLLEQELRLVQLQKDLVARNRDLALTLVAEVNGLVNATNANVQEATTASTQAILTGRTLLLAISAISVGGALLIAWLFVGRVLLRRLQMLSDWMRRMASGDLESRVEIGGRDEVADMAAALEVFRRHALQVQRLNLVEKLAVELQDKNDQLESTLADLNRAQEQVILREKLAALGELTAGVAHEIKNPLNFVKNFSESSEELLDELKEVLDEESESMDEDQQDYIQEISGDLTGNLERIRTHGERANRIVQDMLMMGRGGGDQQLTDINGLLDEYARLAYHSARATDSDFQLDIQQDLDPGMGEIAVVPQDLGRVFLNIVSNACYATDEKRQAAANDASDEHYSPTLWLTTRREADHAEIRIKDNGNGIPLEIVEKIFNPFFTTKPTDRGTGLGLAITSDIVRQHGGAIRVDTEPGQFTEMVIELPLKPGVALSAAVATAE